MTNTPIYSLRKPAGTDRVSVYGQGPKPLNENADIIDAELKRLSDAIENINNSGGTATVVGKTLFL